MKFYGTPNMLVKDRKTKKPLFRFDANGEFVTNDERLIERLKRKFRWEEEVEEERPKAEVTPDKPKAKPTRKRGENVG
jgi:hypothetical protein